MDIKTLFRKGGLMTETELENLLLPHQPFSTEDRLIAWNYYVELLTRVATQSLPKDSGNDAAIMQSFSQLLDISKKLPHPEHVDHPSAIGLLLQRVVSRIVKPFLSNWGPYCMLDKFETKQQGLMRTELVEVQDNLQRLSGILSEICGTEDLSKLKAV